jgi:hypothetical protein
MNVGIWDKKATLVSYFIWSMVNDGICYSFNCVNLKGFFFAIFEKKVNYESNFNWQTNLE